MRRSSPSTRHCASSEIGTRAIPSTQSSPIPRQPSAGSSMTTLVRDRLRPSRSSALQRLSQTRPTALPSARHRPTQAWRETNRPATWRREKPMRGRRCLGQRWIQTTDGWPGIYRWPGYGGPSMDSAAPCLHKGHIFGSIKLVAVIFCAHLRTHTVLWVSCI